MPSLNAPLVVRAAAEGELNPLIPHPIEIVLAQTIARCTGSDTPDCPLLDVLSA